MTLRVAFCLIVLTGAFLGVGKPTEVIADASILYPPTPRSSDTDTYFGTAVANPYRWLEQTQSPEVKDWVSLQTKLSEEQLGALRKRSTLRTLLFDLVSAPRDFAPETGTYATVFARVRSGSSQTMLMVTRSGRTSVLLDPATRWNDSSTLLADWTLSPDGRTVAYATNTSGTGWQRWRTLDTTTATDEPGTLLGVPDWAGGVSWARDSSGFYYNGYGSEDSRKNGTPIGKGFRVWFHRVGTLQSQDKLVYARPDHPDWLSYARETWDGRYIIVGAVEGSGAGGNLIAIRDCRRGDVTRLLRPLGEAQYAYVDNDGPLFYFFTTSNAPRGKLVQIDLRKPLTERDVVPQRQAVLETVGAIGARFIALYLHDVKSQLSIFDRAGRSLHDVPLPGVGTAGGVSGNPGNPVGYYSFSSPTYPHTIFTYDVRTNASTVYSRAQSPFDPSLYVTEEFFAASTGGARIPVFVAHRRDIKLDGTNPTLVTGYGGFDDAYHPVWQNLSAAWLANGGVFAIACVRGGGEYGENWHRAGMLGNKQNAFDDFAAAANMLVERGFASHATLAAYGYSGGGLLVGVTEVQHPRLFSAVAEEAGPVDVLRGYTYGSEAVWADEVGSPVANAEQFHWLYGYAPFVAIRKGIAYPATLVMTSENDQRVSPAHSYKFAATLQWAQGGDKPILLYVARNRGHVEGSRSAMADTLADTEAFLFANADRRGDTQ